MNEQQYRLAKVIIAIIFLIILYLLALNGRYTTWDGELIIDKWTMKSMEEKMKDLIY